MNKTNVLFLCTSNSARSQMAEALLRKYAGDQFEVYSAGLEPKGINPYTVRVMNETGIGIGGQWSKSVSEYLGQKHFGYLITVCSNAEERCPTTFPGIGRRLHWDFEDPVVFKGSDEDTLAMFRKVRDRIDERIRSWLAEQGIAIDPVINRS